MRDSHLLLLGDSVFDNAAYVPGEPSVAEQVRQCLAQRSQPGAWQVTLCAEDGAVTSEVPGQLYTRPAGVTIPICRILSLRPAAGQRLLMPLRSGR